MNEIEVKIPAAEAGSYRISIGNDILDSLWDRIETDFSQLNKFVVTDENLVSAGHLEALLGQRSVPYFVITPAGETSKNINTVVSIIETMEKAYFGRDSLIVALG
ncbi:MAG: hypothetical protein ACYS0I_13495, partial [Planctomycetota bacterium]